jgi:hypothetical protein
MLGVDHADIYAVFGPTNVAIHGAQIAVEIGDGRGAVQRGRGVDLEKLSGGLVERRAQLFIDLARACCLTEALVLYRHWARTAAATSHVTMKLVHHHPRPHPMVLKRPWRPSR